MDFSVKVTAETGPDQRDGCSESQTDVASPLYFGFKAEQAEGSASGLRCPACPLVLGSRRELSNHLRSGHNSPRTSSSGAGSGGSAECSGEEAEYACGVCHKLLSSASSLDRHVLVHSGERPFKCRLCPMAFTTNGNMNRHLRSAHAPALSPSRSCSDSEASSDSEPGPRGRRHRLEYNNNNELLQPQPGLKRKCAELAEGPRRRHKALLPELRPQGQPQLGCPGCARRDFASGAQLEEHLERRHPELASEARCDSCDLAFNSHRSLYLHRYTSHFSELAAGHKGLRNSVVGFDDLSFVDFSCGKFPTIARVMCERALHRPASAEQPHFQCANCLRAFPCLEALDAHASQCGQQPDLAKHHHHHQQQLHHLQHQQNNRHHHQQQQQHHQHRPPLDEQSSRNSFFAGLDLQNKAALAEAKEGKDLADIQSIISLTSGPILHSFSRSDASTPDHCKTTAKQQQQQQQQHNLGSSGSSGTPSSEFHEEDANQDDLTIEFRRMKSKGQFPCRLCEQVYPNLRALKGHNRVHTNVIPPGMPYPCNMCPYTSNDKATLMRHLRSHNGDRPYECSLCHFAFTTKANCERHVRNRHGKLSRDEIKSVLIYHPNEDSANDASQERAPSRNEVRKSLVYPSERDEPAADEALDHQPAPTAHHAAFPGVPPAYDTDPGEQPPSHDDLDSNSSDGSVSLVSEAKPVPRAAIINESSPIDLKKPSTESSPEEAGRPTGEDVPLDLSMDALDLSKKARADAAAAAAAAASAAASVAASAAVTTPAATTTTTVVEQDDKESGDVNGNDAEDLSANQKEFYNTTNQLLLTQALLKAGQVGGQPSSLEALYANAHMLYRNFGSFPGMGAGILQPYLFNHHLFNPDFTMKDRLQKELVRGLQTSGGSLVEPPGSGYAAAFPQQRNPMQNRNVNDQNDYASMMSAKLSNKSLPPRDKPDASPASNSVKMVIKNGVLMPKQKQRRYRTERPFTCEHCSARFTLRSNMERHIKQQHPQHWSQRPRGGHSTRGRPPANPPTLLQNLRQPPSQLAYPSLLPKLNHSLGQDYGKHAISDQVKYAILAQQLKGNKPEENETDEELVIDEETAEKAKEPTERTLSLLRGKLEANIESKSSEDFDANVRTASAAKSDIKEEIDEEAFGQTLVESENNNEQKELSQETTVKAEPLDHMKIENSENRDLASVSEILDNASQNYSHFQAQYMSDEEGLVASTSDCNQSGSDEKSDSFHSGNSGNSTSSKKKKKMKKKKKNKNKSAYSLAPNRVICPYCQRPFPWTSSLRRHILTHTGQKPYQCMFCSLLFTTKSNCDRHLLRKHKNSVNKIQRTRSTSSPEPQEPPTMVPLNPTTTISTTTTTTNAIPTSNGNSNGNANSNNNTVNNSINNSINNSTNNSTNNSNNNNNNNNNINNNNSSNSNCNNSFAMRNVPERPYKCNQCPSSTFSTLGNLKKHKSTKHPLSCEAKSRPESPINEFQQNSPQESPMQESPLECAKPEPMDCDQDFGPECAKQNNDQSGYESQSSGVSEGVPDNSCSIPSDLSKANALQNSSGTKSKKTSPTASPGPTVETPFKCHLCDSGFAERQDCLDHIKDIHPMEFEILVTKGALDMDIDLDDPYPMPPSDGEGGRGRYPDYSSRKVMCGFCMRRFWSTEDLRRHMRTHTGERPFSCDICCRRFTLKHSMLRHRKKHETVESSMYVGGTSCDEEVAPSMSQPPTITPRSQQQEPQQAGPSSRASLPQVASVATADAAPHSLANFNPYTLTGKLSAGISPDANDNNTDNDLISNLLGIRDKSIIDKVLVASADDAAKLLGVKGNHE